MPFFGGKKKGSKDNLSDSQTNTTRPGDDFASSNGTAKPESVSKTEPSPQPRPKLVFHCQQAHGSPTGIISGFTNVKELYQKIADCYDMNVNEVGVFS